MQESTQSIPAQNENLDALIERGNQLRIAKGLKPLDPKVVKAEALRQLGEPTEGDMEQAPPESPLLRGLVATGKFLEAAQKKSAAVRGLFATSKFLQDAQKESAQMLADLGTGAANIALRGLHIPGEVPRARIDTDVTNRYAKILGSVIGPLFLGPLGVAGGAETAAGRVAQQVALQGALAGTMGAARGEREALPAALVGGAAGGALSGLAEAPTPILRGIRAAIFRGKEAAKRLATAREQSAIMGEDPVSLGDISDSPSLRGFYHSILAHIPGSGAKRYLNTVVGKTQKIADTLQAKFLGTPDHVLGVPEEPTPAVARQLTEKTFSDPNVPEEQIPVENRELTNHQHRRTPQQVDELLRTDLRDYIARQETRKRILYDNVNRYAKEVGFTLPDTPNLKNFAKSTLADASSLEVLRPSDVKVLERAVIGRQEPTLNEGAEIDYSKPGYEAKQIVGNPKEPISDFNKAALNMSAYDKLARKASATDPTNLFRSSMYRELRQNLQKDITDAIDPERQPLLKWHWDEAKQHFKNNIVPTRAKGLREIVDTGKGLERLPQLLIKKENESILKNGEPTMRGLVAFKLLKDAFPYDAERGTTTADPVRLIKAYEQLIQERPELKDRLFSEDDQFTFRKLKSYVKASGLENAEKRPAQTDAKKIASLISHIAVPVTAVGATALAPKLVGPGLTALGGARAATKLLTAPALRRAILRGGIGQQPELIRRLITALAQMRAGRVGRHDVEQTQP